MALAYEIVHRLPGRVRLRLSAIHHKPDLAAGLQDLLGRQRGVRDARANANVGCITVEFQPDAFELNAWLDQVKLEEIPVIRVRPNKGNRLTGRRLHPSPLSDIRRQTFAFESLIPPKMQCVISIASLVVCWLDAPLLLTRLALITSISPIFNRAVQTGLDEGKIGADALDSASCLLLVWHQNFGAAALMTFLISLGELMRDEISQGCERLFAHQLELGANSAWLISGHRRIRTPVKELKPGDHVAVYAGELIPVVGKIYDGEGTVVPASPEMDFEPQQLRVGDSVCGNLILTDGKLYIESEQGAMCPLFDPVVHKQSRRWLQRTRLHKQALHLAHQAILPMLSAAALLFVITKDVRRAIAIITFDFVTGVKIAIPTAVLSSMYKAGSRGVVIRNASALERLSRVDAVIFARGGALTALQPQVTEIFVCDGYALDQVTRLAAAVVQRYNHLGASAIIKHANLNKIPVPERSGSSVRNNLGVSATVEGHDVFVGSTSLLRLENIDLTPVQEFLEKSQKRGDTRACVAIDGKLAGVIAYQDPIREDARSVVAALKRLGVSEFAVVSSGGQVAAQMIAESAGITKVHYRALPEDQANIVRGYKRRGLHVAVVGHDAANTLALEQADVAVSLETGADVAVHRADVVLTGNSLSGLVEGIEISRAGMSLAKQNLAATVVSNLGGLALSFFDKLEFLAATWVNNGSVIVAAANGLRPLLDHPGEDEGSNSDGVSKR